MKKLISIFCVLCLIMGSLPVIAWAAVAPTEDLHLNFNATDWSGNTEYITDEGLFNIPGVGNSNKYSLTYKDTLDLSKSDFSVSTYLRPIHSTSNFYGDCILAVGDLELRVLMKKDENNNGIFWLSVVYNGTELATHSLTSSNHFYEIVNTNGYIRVKVDNSYVKLTDTSGNTVDGVSNQGMSFSSCDISILLCGNWSLYRYAKGCVVDINYADRTTNDVSYPNESLYILDPDRDDQAISYLNTAVTIPSGEDNTLVSYNYDGTYFDSDLWRAVPMLSQELIDRGFIEGGEACQAVSSMVTSSDGQLAMIGIDIGGLYRSLDGGAHWQPATIGLGSGGATGIAIDPKNKNHVIAVGANTGAARSNGLYVTTDAFDQCEWTKALSASDISGTYTALASHNDFRIQIVYDLNSYSSKLGYCTTAYWSVEDKTITRDGVEYKQQAMWKSTDGGFSWKKLENVVGTIYLDGVAQADSSFLAGAEMASYTSGSTTYIYAATPNGFYISTNGGKNWTETLSSYGVSANAIDVIDTCVSGHDSSKVGYIWASTDNALYRSTDFGYTWAKVDGVYYPVKESGVRVADNISVSSLNPDNLYVTHRGVNGAGWYSNNGGKSWRKTSQYKNEAWQPVSGISPYGYWSNIYEDTFYCSANGIWKSIDGGANLHWSNSGYNGIFAPGHWTFNINNPNLVSIPSQDYNGGFSTDGGKTWTYLSWLGEGWGGYTYGSYMLDRQTVITCVSTGWTDERQLWATHDAGKTYVNTGITVKGSTTAMGCLGDDSIAFMGEWRTDDYGYTWTEMLPDSSTGSTGCDGIYAIDYKRGTLFGRKDNRVVYSSDKGITWHQIAVGGGIVEDIAYDHESGIIYVTSAETLYSGHIDFSKTDNPLYRVEYLGSGVITYASSVAIDPNNPQVVYVAGFNTINSISYDNGGVFRSLDSGKTWTRLTRTAGDGRDLCADGGKTASNLRVNPNTGELFASGACKGVWKIAAPPQWYLDGNYTAPDTHPSTPAESELTDQSKVDLIETGKYANYSGYEPKEVVLELVDANAMVENGYFKVPDGVTVYVGDTIKLGCPMVTAFTYPNGLTVDFGCINTTWVKNQWGEYYKQACSNSSGYYQFTEPGSYTIYTVSGTNEHDGWAMVTFYVADPYAGYTAVSNQSELAAIADNLNGNYILTDDIVISGSWTSIGSSSNPFKGVIYGNGHTISGINSALVGTNNGGISHLNVSGDVIGSMIAGTNNSYIAYCSISGSAGGLFSGGIASTNNGLIKNCLVAADVSGGAVSHNNSGSINGCYYPSDKSPNSSGSLAEGDVNYTYTDLNDAAQFDNLDDNWYVTDGYAPVLRIERGYDLDTLTGPLDDYTIDGEYLYIDRLDTLSSDLVGLYDLEGATVSMQTATPSGAVRTGDTLSLTWYDSRYTLTAVIVGDVLGDGCMTGAGMLSVQLFTVGQGSLSDAAQKAADLDRDGRLTSADALVYQQSMLGITDILG